ncbi:MAG TPA: isocitrate lyase/PEP mutase family protein [Alphaproteobacteria bacterium]|jgi:2-methylisocitrate lyase-like PEP mutase family enzyme|nr:isocitrate lyase/PEP mutase family protein [Alphaproteobacteria bacterium]
MTAKPTWRELLAREKPLVLPGAHDALSARLIEMAGFAAYVIGGYPVVGARFGLPDLGLVGLGEMSGAIRDIMSASSLPVLIDADHGYGDVKNVTRTIRTYEDMGASAIFIEDQVAPKRCGHMAGKDVVPAETMEKKIRAAVAARRDRETFIIARTDARAVHGLDEALRRGERYIKAGADGLFVEAPETVAELETIAKAFDVPQFCNMLDGGKTPILSNRELHEMGYAMVVHGITLIMRIARTMHEALADLRADRLSFAGGSVSFEEFKQITRFKDWAEIEDRFGR